MRMKVWACAFHGARVEVRGQLSGDVTQVWGLLLPAETSANLSTMVLRFKNVRAHISYFIPFY